MEIGKKYKRKASGFIFTCVAISINGRPILQYKQERELVEVLDPDAYEEYVEPQFGIGWVNIYSDHHMSAPHRTKKEADKQANASIFGRIACVKVSWTEGQFD